MRQSNILVYLLPVVLLGCAMPLGCAAKNSQLATCQAEKEQLLTTIRSQRDTTRDLNTQVASLESRLDQAEKEIARGGGNTRISSRPSETPPAVKSESLPWRLPAGGQRSEGGGRRSADASLLALARRDRRVQYDSAARAAKIDLPIAFDDEAATLTAQDKRQLDELARLLRSDDARELRVMVAGFSAGRPSTTAPKADGEDRFSSSRQLGAARAQAVADYLDRHGIAQERLGISGTGARTSTDKLARGVQIYLLEPDAPVVGWGPSDQPLRR